MDLQAAIYSGMTSDTSPSDVDAFCSADRCEWDSYTTLAICASTEDVSGRLFARQSDSNITLPEIREDPPLGKGARSFWTITQISDYLSAPHILQSTVTIGDVYMVFYPPCDNQSETRGFDRWLEERKDPKNWKAFKGSFQPCLQTLKTIYLNATTATNVLETQDNLSWELIGGASSDPYSNGSFCYTRPDGENEQYCISAKDMREIFEQGIGPLFKGTGSFATAGDNYFIGDWIPTLATDIIGNDPVVCSPSAGGLHGFTRRLDNIAASLTNA